MTQTEYTYLYRVDSPDDLKRLSIDELGAYCDEVRHFIIESLASNPGHLGSSLGAVELTAALHYVYNTPDDKLIWDVGHQAYAHKIITGRRDVFSTNRKFGGISGFPRMCESPYDAFGGGHASVSISAALGMAEAARLKGEKRGIVAVIGDGALTGGLAFEGLNNAGGSNADVLVVLNDNHMSIDANVGAVKEYLLHISTSVRYNKFKTGVWNSLSRTPRLRTVLQNAGNAVKQGILQQSNLFESLNFRYFGPVDGHDVKTMIKVLQNLREIPGPKLLHVLTVKGKGYEPAEIDPPVWHAPGRFNPETGELLMASDFTGPPRYQDVFGETLLELARANDRIVGITPAMPKGCSLNIMMNEMPERCFDVGIAEGHAVTFSAGLSAQGMIPFCNIYSSFMQRAYDNVVHDVALQNLPVVLCLDRAGLVGEDGPTHHGTFDLAYLRPIPNLVVAAPMDEVELRNLMYTAQVALRPFVIRYPRGNGVTADWRRPFAELPVGRGRILREGTDVAVISVGTTGQATAKAVEMAAADGISAAHYDLRYVKPLDGEMLHGIGGRFGHVITVEDGVIRGGAGSGVLEFFERHGYGCRVTMLGIPDEFITHGKPDELHRLCGYDAEGIHRTIMEQ